MKFCMQYSSWWINRTLNNERKTRDKYNYKMEVMELRQRAKSLVYYDTSKKTRMLPPPTYVQRNQLIMQHLITEHEWLPRRDDFRKEKFYKIMQSIRR